MSAPGLAVLAGFQQAARDTLAASIRVAAEYLRHDPGNRDVIARTVGVMLLESPTGSGKTLTLGRTLEAVRGRLPERCVWFWFAPYAGLVAQTRNALAEQCPSLRLRDLAGDREVAMVRDGDVFVQTWASVAAANKESRRVRRDSEGAPSLDAMLAALRAEGVHVGVVIDEAHLNFGVTAKAAARFYLETLRPDFTLLATATPNDDKLREFERLAGVAVDSRVVVERAQVVEAALNKRGLRLGVVRFDEATSRLMEPEAAALAAGWDQHGRVVARLAERGLKVSPLMLVQVEDQAKGGADPVARVKAKLLELGVPEAAIRTHTSGQPDPEFHTLAFDDRVAVLVFKVAVATGFDAPRAWTLVSLRPSRGKAFGLQIVGRIMRVHPRVRPVHGTDDVLDRGYVFLTDPVLQAGLDAAAEELKAVRASIAAVSDELSVLEFSNLGRMHEGPHSGSLLSPPPRDAAERERRREALVEAGVLPPAVRARPAAEQDVAIVQGEWRRRLADTPLFGPLPESEAVVAPAVAPRGKRLIPLRTDLDLPRALLREQLPPAHEWTDAVIAAAARALFRQRATPVDHLAVAFGRASVDLRDLFLEDQPEQRELKLRMSSARVAEAAEGAFAFNDQLDRRLLKRGLLEEFRRVCEAQGREYDEVALRRALDLFALKHPRALVEAFREAQGRFLRVGAVDPLPALPVDADAAPAPARLSAWGVFPPGMNGEERSFAELLDADASGRVRWWAKLQEGTKWAATLILPSGRHFFPDFAVGIEGRRTPDHVALVEVKDDGGSGRLHADDNLIKIKAEHREYRGVAWAVREDGVWVSARLEPGIDRIRLGDRFDVERLG